MPSPPSLRSRLARAFVVLLGAAFLAEAILSLGWRMSHDSPLFAYIGFLMNRQGLFPYRDFFETSMPGTFVLHAAITRLFGYGDLAFRIVDLAWLSALMAITWGILARFGRLAAWAGGLLFALAYFQEGPGMSFQRDYAAVLPLALAVLIAVSSRGPRTAVRIFIAGSLFGLAATIKPHLLIGLPPLIFYVWIRDAAAGEEADGRDAPIGAVAASATAACGAAVPILACMAWIGWNGAWPRFTEMVFDYLPLHLRLTGEHRTVAGFDRLEYLLFEYRRLGGHALWLLPASFGFLRTLARGDDAPDRRRLAFLLGGLAAIYSLYPVLSGQFFAYHWMPFLYFVALAAALCLADEPAGGEDRASPGAAAAPAVLVLSSLLLIAPPADVMRQIRGLPPAPPEQGRADEAAAFLRDHLRPGDTVQPLDWTGGAIHGMLIARARLATSFLYDYHFYHHVSEPFIQALRWRFLQELDAAAPRFIVEVPEEKPWVWGPDTSRDFPGLRERLTRDYTLRLDDDGLRIYERRAP